jgi:hypothetical protein
MTIRSATVDDWPQIGAFESRSHGLVGLHVMYLGL